MSTENRRNRRATHESKKTAAFISDVRVFPVDDGKGILANVSVTFGGVFVVTGIKVIDGKKGEFVSMPQYKGKDNEWHDSAFPITKEFREQLAKEVLDAYYAEIDGDDLPM